MYVHEELGTCLPGLLLAIQLASIGVSVEQNLYLDYLLNLNIDVQILKVLLAKVAQDRSRTEWQRGLTLSLRINYLFLLWTMKFTLLDMKMSIAHTHNFELTCAGDGSDPSISITNWKASKCCKHAREAVAEVSKLRWLLLRRWAQDDHKSKGNAGRVGRLQADRPDLNTIRIQCSQHLGGEKWEW